jgi:hypothetical protein
LHAGHRSHNNFEPIFITVDTRLYWLTILIPVANINTAIIRIDIDSFGVDEEVVCNLAMHNVTINVDPLVIRHIFDSPVLLLEVLLDLGLFLFQSVSCMVMSLLSHFENSSVDEIIIDIKQSLIPLFIFNMSSEEVISTFTETNSGGLGIGQCLVIILYVLSNNIHAVPHGYLRVPKELLTSHSSLLYNCPNLCTINLTNKGIFV